MARRFVSVLLVMLALSALAWFLGTPRALAANQIVSDCGDNGGANQLRAKINDAQTGGGGTITFTCSPNVVLNGSVLPIITTNLTINGGNTITLSGNSTSRILYVGGTGTLTLNNITLSKGYFDGDGGAIRNDGKLNINNSKFLGNETTLNGNGGAIVSLGAVNAVANLNITNSEFANNKGRSAGALYVKWPYSVATISGSSFHDNEAMDRDNGWGGAILVFDGASATIHSTTFSTNKAGHGGAIYNYYATTTLDNHSEFSKNSVPDGTTLPPAYGKGGAIDNDHGTTNLTDVILRENRASDGGGIFSDHGIVDLVNVDLAGNTAEEGPGGGIYNKGGTATLKNVSLRSNYGDYGGGIRNMGGTINLTNVTLNFNTAGQAGGIMTDDGTATLMNVTLSGNGAGYTGGIYSENSTLTLTNVTLSGNSATNGGGGLYKVVNGTATLKNTLFAKGTSGSNCVDADDGFLGGSFSLSDDGTCDFGAGRDNVNNLLLGPLAYNGGFALTHLPGAGSAAIDNGTGSGCPSPDQRGVSRPQGLTCDVGSVEVQPATPTPTRTATRTATRAPTKTLTRTATRTPTKTATRTVTRTVTRTATKTATRSLTPANTRTATRTPTTPGCTTKPAKPNLTAPGNGTVNPPRVTLKWTNVTCEDKYKVLVKDADTGEKAFGKKLDPDVTQVKTKVLPPGDYKWFVKACNGAGCNKSSTRSFTVQ